MAELLITTASHFFKITKITPRAREAINKFASTLIHYNWVKDRGNYSKMPVRVFATSTMDRSEYRFHINQLSEFICFIKGFGLVDDLVGHDSIPFPMPVQVELKMKPEWVLRDYQIPIVEYLTSVGPPVAKFLNLQTGMGKGICALKAMSTIRHRTLIVVKPMYLEKWEIEINEKYDIDPDDVLVIRGSSQLLTLLSAAENGELTAKIILVSMKTLSNWIKLYEKFQYETTAIGYACIPEDFCKLLGVGILLIDEAHQEFHAAFKILLNTNVYRSISLSATLKSDDPFISKMYGVVYPVHLQYAGEAYRRYVSSTAIFYRFKDPFKIKHLDRVSSTYSHHMFEQSILRDKVVTSNYFNLIWETFKGSYLQYYKPNQKCLIFCISIEMCELVVKYLRDKLSSHSGGKYFNLSINKYTAEDDFDSLMTSDISVSTLGSAGTAVDIAGLSTVILTIAVSSIQANLQSLGRLRPLKDGSTPRFLYFVCTDIPKHLQYHEQKRTLMENKALSYTSVNIGTPL